jgi:NAD(P)H-dependent FMN reductase
VIQILAISGSLRHQSVNTAVLRAASILAPEDVKIDLYGNLGEIPLFNPDIENTEPASVRDFRSQLSAADGLMIASPEYAHGVTGVLKNALDWAVGSEEFDGKPVALLNTSIRATHAYAALAETITTMGGKIVPAASLLVPLPSNTLDVNAILASPELAEPIRRAVEAMSDACSPAVAARSGVDVLAKLP